MEEIYIGTKIIVAEPMSEKDFLIKVKGQDKNMVVYGGVPDRPGYKVRYEDGYISWSPKETFERAYRKVTMAEASMVIMAVNNQAKKVGAKNP